MRTREEIIAAIQREPTFRSGNDAMTIERATLEVLLDIRDLLINSQKE